MGICTSIYAFFGCNEPEWSEVCHDPSSGRYKKWLGNPPKNTIMCLSKIKDINYQNLLVNLASQTKNTYSDDLVDEVIGVNRQKRPRLIRVSKRLDFSTLTLYEKLQFLSTDYPRVCKLESGHSSGYNGFIHLTKKKRVIYHRESVNNIHHFKEEMIHATESKINVFHHKTRRPEYKTINPEKYIAWDIGGITGVDRDRTLQWTNIMCYQIVPTNIEAMAASMLIRLKLPIKDHIWGLSKFIQSIVESYKTIPINGVQFRCNYYKSDDTCLLIRNGNVPEMIETENEKELYVDSINSLPEFVNNQLSYEDIFGDSNGNHKLVEHYDLNTYSSIYESDKCKLLKQFYNEYSVVGNHHWCNSNINYDNINTEYSLIPINKNTRPKNSEIESLFSDLMEINIDKNVFE